MVEKSEAPAAPFDFKTCSVPDALARLACKPGGLSSIQARERLAQYGPNRIEEHHVPAWRKFLGHFTSPISIIIFAAAALSFFIGDLPDAGVIFFLLLLNVSIGFYIERQADVALATLSKKLAVRARVRRDGAWGEEEADTLVPGDLVELAAGHIVPADAKLIEGDIEVDQSALTGESLPVALQPRGLAYASSLVRKGRARALIVLTGGHTTFGRTAQLAQMSKPKSHLDKAIEQIGHFLILLSVLGALVVVGVGVVRGYTLAETALLALTLLVASVPAAMPAVLATIMAMGALHLAKKHAVVRQLSALEALASVNVICSDKTGTLTLNQIKVQQLWPWRVSEDELLRAARRCVPLDSDDPIDQAIEHHGLLRSREIWKLEKFVQADSVRKRATAYLARMQGGRTRRIVAVKGAPQVVLALCRMGAGQKKAALKQVEKFAQEGYRTLAVAQKELSGADKEEKGAVFVGLIALADPARPDARQTVRKAGQMGILVKMVSGDHAAVVRHVADDIGIKGRVLAASVLGRLRPAQARMEILRTGIFAEVLPEQKYQIVKAHRANGDVVAVTGDGVNDAPALKEADAGVAVEGATEVAKSAADLVLTKPGLSVIVEAVEEGRAIFERMHHYVIYRLAETFRVLFLVPASIIVLGFFPLTPIQLVVLSVLNDVPILAMATDNVEQPKAPEKWRVKRLLGVSSMLGVVGLFNSGLLLFVFYFVFHLPLAVIQTLLFLKLSLAGHLMVFHARSPGPIFKSKPPSRTLLAAIVGTQLIATAMALMGIFVQQVGIVEVVGMWIWVFIFLFITEHFKHLAYVAADRMGW
ncbi:Copper-exporting P-type ATPase B [uncultured archaeon]|nr:Copper-exporting P-type ATPase B [uncultured archaeon]